MVFGRHSVFGEGGPIFLEWLQGDGSTGYVDTGFVVQDYMTRMTIEAAYQGGNTNNYYAFGAVVMAGCESDTSSSERKMFGFSPRHKDRQIWMNVGLGRAWNNPAYAGSWDGGSFHVINVGAVSGSQISATLDGVDVGMSLVSAGSFSDLPTESQTIFASKADGGYYLLSSQYKVRRVAYKLDGVFLADFRAAAVNKIYGFYDVVGRKFAAGHGSLTAGSVIAKNGGGG